MKVLKSLIPYDILISVPNTTKMYRLSDDDNIVIGLNHSDQRELIRWFFQNTPEMIRDVICEECPEHIEHIENGNYCENKAERRK